MHVQVNLEKPQEVSSDKVLQLGVEEVVAYGAMGALMAQELEARIQGGRSNEYRPNRLEALAHVFEPSPTSRDFRYASKLNFIMGSLGHLGVGESMFPVLFEVPEPLAEDLRLQTAA